MAKTTDNIPAWQFNVIPGNANQGAILLTRNVITNPPFNQDDFIWKAMEDIIGTADVRLDYDEENNKYHIFKAKGHLDNKDNWTYDWEEFGTWDALTPEVTEILRRLNYVEYVFDTSVANRLRVVGVKKDGTRVEICNLTFASKAEFDTAVQTLTNNLNNEISRATNRENQIQTNLTNEITRATNREDELEAQINTNKVISGNATTINQTTNGRQVDVNVDNDSIKVVGSNLKATVFDDTQVSNTKGWTSAKITQELTSAMTYEGQVATYNDLPTGLSVNDKGKTYNVADTGDNYTWNGTEWDKLSGDYIAGPGIDITGKVISSTGISFGTGDGLTVTGSGTEATVSVYADKGLYFNNKKLNVNVGTGVQIDSNNRVAAKVNTNQGVRVDNNGIGVKLGNGLQFSTDGKVETIPVAHATQAVDVLNEIETNVAITATIPYVKSYSHTLTQAELDASQDAYMFGICEVVGSPSLRFYRIEVRVNNKILYMDNLNAAGANMTQVSKAVLIVPVASLRAGDVLSVHTQLISTVDGNIDSISYRVSFR